MTISTNGLGFDPDTWAAIEQAAYGDGLSPQDWTRAVVVDHLRRIGALPNEPDSLRPEELNANNDG